MGKHKLILQDMKGINFPSDVIRRLALNIMNRHFKHTPIEEKLNQITDVLEHPENYRHHELLGIIALKLLSKEVTEPLYDAYDLDESPKPFEVFGHKHIERNALQQMEIAMRLPVAVKGAVMPDAHHGFGLPIGGVLATENAVIPYGVGMDIGCRMALTILDLPGSHVLHHDYALKKALGDYTHFGNDGGLDFRQEHEILDHPGFQDTELLRKLHGKAVRQLGTSGSGNHFVEFGTVVLDKENTLGIPGAVYAALLSHSGSRSLGANIAQHYTNVAMAKCKLPGAAKSLAWLTLDSDEGQAYWHAMQLAGEYAKACHDQIHRNLCRALGFQTLATVENHHNFAWKELDEDGRELVVHRKGATPAQEGVYGILPGSMLSAGYIVRGRGNALSINSAAHGAGRKMSRQKAKDSITMSSVKKMLQAEKITLIGGSPEEAPGAYKDIDTIMKSQGTLVTIEGKFYPRVVRMAKD